MNAMFQPLYGNYRNRKFNDIYPEVEQFEQDYDEFNNGILDASVSGTAIDTIWLLLSARYGNSTVASQNEEQFKLKLFSTIFMYGPTWEKKVEIQKSVRGLIQDGKISEDLLRGGKAIYNTALNPGQKVAGGKGSATGEGTNTLDELTYINQQNTTNYQKSLPEAYSILTNLLETDVTSAFLDRFKKLFLTVVTPELPLWYVSDSGDFNPVGPDEDDTPPEPNQPDDSEKVKELQEEIKRLNEEIKSLNKTIDNLQGIIDSGDNEIKQKYNAVATVLSDAPFLKDYFEGYDGWISDARPKGEVDVLYYTDKETNTQYSMGWFKANGFVANWFNRLKAAYPELGNTYDPDNNTPAPGDDKDQTIADLNKKISDTVLWYKNLPEPLVNTSGIVTFDGYYYHPWWGDFPLINETDYENKLINDTVVWYNNLPTRYDIKFSGGDYAAFNTDEFNNWQADFPLPKKTNAGV